MAVIRGKVFTSREIVTSGKTVGNWPFKDNGDTAWIREDGREVFERKSLLDVLKDENIEFDTSEQLRTGTR